MSAKSDILKRIDDAVKRKKNLAKVVSREKTILSWVCDFFKEVGKFKGNRYGSALALGLLANKLRTLDNQCSVSLMEPEEGPAFVEIRWSATYAQANNCEDVTTLDEATAFLQGIFED